MWNSIPIVIDQEVLPRYFTQIACRTGRCQRFAFWINIALVPAYKRFAQHQTPIFICLILIILTNVCIFFNVNVCLCFRYSFSLHNNLVQSWLGLYKFRWALLNIINLWISYIVSQIVDWTKLIIDVIYFTQIPNQNFLLFVSLKVIARQYDFFCQKNFIINYWMILLLENNAVLINIISYIE